MAVTVPIPNEMVVMARVLIGDILTPQTYLDATIEQVVAVAAQIVNTELDFLQTFVIDQVGLTISPDPTDNTSAMTRDDAFIDLVCMYAACIFERQEAKKAASQAIDIKDGKSAVSLRGAAQYKIMLLNVNWCKSYQEAADQYMVSKQHLVGASITGPFRVWAFANGFLHGATGYDAYR